MSNFKQKYKQVLKCYIDGIVANHGIVGVEQTVFARHVRKHLYLYTSHLNNELIEELVSEAFVKKGNEHEQ